ncbi:P-loop containing nucleoside triphosphate hydrolase protein [Scleroderma citrinum]
MPRIRKKTSKRGRIHQRERIKHKVSEHRKRVKKQARKDKAAGKVQKKSKKDPGIPNAYPYKDEILAEIQQKRLETAAEKQRRRAEKRAALVASKNGNEEAQSQTSQDAEDEEGRRDIDIGENDGRGFDGITSLKNQLIILPQAQQRKTTIDAENNVQKVPAVPVCPGPSTLRGVLDKADVLVCVVDARDPEAGIGAALMKEAQEKGKSIIVVVNKADTIPRESLVEWLAHLRRTYVTIPFRVSSAFMPTASPYNPSAKGAKAVCLVNDALGAKALWSLLESFANRKEGDELVVAVTGVTNSGKSSMINTLFGAETLPIYNPLSSAEAAKLPYTTTIAQEVVVPIPDSEGLKVRFIDTPGLEFSKQEFSDINERHASRARDILLRCRGRIDRLKDPMFAVTHIISRAEMQDLMLAYNLPAFSKGDTTAFLAGIARVNGLVKTRGVLDHAGAARIVLRDWSLGKLARYTMPTGQSGASSPVDGDEEVLRGLRTRKELRKAKDVKLVKLTAGEVDKRDVLLDEKWEVEGEREEDETEAGEGEESEEDEDADGEEEESDVESDDVPQLLPPATKRKRTVSFAVPVKRRQIRK